MVDLETGDEVFDVPASMAGPHITVINCLLYRDDAGVLVGILNHYDGRHELEKADAVNIWVRPDWQCRGIGSALVVEALRRWPGVRPEGQRYTDSGVRLLESLLRRSEQQ
jgi:ribosomal protein S18 acetylase RimI-like enzyme